MALIQSQGYVRGSQRYHLTLLEHFDVWLARQHLPLDRISEKLVAQFLDSLVRAKWVHVSAPATMRRLIGMLREEGVVPAVANELTAIDQAVAQYERFLVGERALSPATAASWIIYVRRLLAEKFEDASVELERLNANDVIAFVQRHARRHGPSYTRKLVVSTRSFLRYLHYKGLHPQDLSTVVPKVARWSLSTLPKHLPADQVRRVIKACDRSTPLGRRNYAILLLLARLGLRAGEVIRLQLDDIDWEQGCLLVRGKAGRAAQLPLPADAAQAMARYIQRDRPRCACRALFIRDYAPLQGLGGSGAIATVVFDALKVAGVKSARAGAHLLRHSLATDMLGRGASLDEIGEILRHRSADTTAIYAKVDLNALRSLALAWPGGAQ
ncbi:MAG TPA: tyrosine-type recombinase/integrase [Solirubrobacterales bacterium]|jgi:site-specific recombinase XerD|nr:tyrosine-type recombinase/integrase [Solirubrobacterales bacterium]